MAYVILIALAVGLAVLLFFLVRCWLFGRHVVRNFKASNVIVDGKKGKGKDLLFQYVIRKRRKPYFANVSYGGRWKSLDLKSLSVSPNDYESFIDGEIEQVERVFPERMDAYISDGGVYLPSYADSLLHKHYKSLPLFYPLSRHLADMNVHVNVQNLSRVWKPIREQADFFVHVKGRVKLPFHILIHANTYDKEESALRCLEPMKGRILNKFSKAEVDAYRAEHGEIKSGWLILPKRWIEYDTRAFEKILFGDQARIDPSALFSEAKEDASASVRVEAKAEEAHN